MARRRPATSLALQWVDLTFAVPQVVGHRMARLALAGPTPSPRDRREFARMANEKSVAFAASWQAMSTQSLFAGQALAWAACRSWLDVATGRPTRSSAAAMSHAVASIMHGGLAPIHRTAVDNAKRLATTRLR